MTAKDPRTSEEIYDSIVANLKSNFSSAADKLSNFAPTSFNYIFTNAFAQQQHQQEVATTATQLSGWVNYAGKELNAEDLNELNIDGATPQELNEFQDSEHLEQFAAAFGVTRDPGSYATGELEITSNSTTTVSGGTVFGTQPNSQGEFVKFVVLGEVGSSYELTDESTWNDIDFTGSETVTAAIRGELRGSDYNVGSGTITYLPNPPAGISSVTNPAPTSGGDNEQSDAELREDVKNSITESVEGGTVDGVQGFVENNSGASSVIIDEKKSGDQEHGSYPHVHVIAFGGTDSSVNDAIDFARPAGVEHFLIRPTQIAINIDADLEGDSIDVTSVEDELTRYFAQINLNEPVYKDQVINRIMGADQDIENIQTLRVKVANESHTFSTGTDVYQLDKQLDTDDYDGIGITEVTGTLNGSTHTFVEDTDYQEWNSSAGDTSPPQDAIDWSLAGDDPDDATDFFVTYEVREDVSISLEEVAVLNQANITVV